MQNNKVKKHKNKPIKKSKSSIPQQNSNNNKKSKFLFQDTELLDLISSSQAQQQIQQQNPIPIQHQNNDLQLKEQQQRLEMPDRKIMVSNQERWWLVQVGKYYKAKMGKDNRKYRISNVHPQEKVQINGKQLNQYYPQNTFIFKINRNKSIKKNNQFLNKMSAQQNILIKQAAFEMNFKRQTFIRTNFEIFLQVTAQPWVDLPGCVHNNDSLMILGAKNTGKSMLGQYILNLKDQECAFLDCDLGRNSSLQGCVSISCTSITKKIWIGQLTPLNNLQTYLRAIQYLHSFYRDNWFTKKLIINTMGYTTGLGQFLLYQIYQIIKPKQIIILQPTANGYNPLSNIIRQIQSGQYLQKLYINKSQQNVQYLSSSQLYYYENVHSSSKKGISRFQKSFQTSKKIVNICDLLQIIQESSGIFKQDRVLNYRLRNTTDIYQQGKHQKSQVEGREIVCYRKLDRQESIDMRLIILGRFVSSHPLGRNIQKQTLKQKDQIDGLFQVIELGFGFNGRIYSKLNNEEDIVGIVNEGMDFEKGFYHLNQKQLLQYQLKNGRLNYLIVSQKCLGSKGVRNNPSKTI